MRSFMHPVMLCVLIAGMAGCGSTASDAERLNALLPDAQPTIPVSGQVLVDGTPMKDIWVKLHPEGGAKNAVQPKALTDADGHFQITTYVGGDGAPAGKYKLTLEWLTFQQIGNTWLGPNKLDGPGGAVKTTPYEVTVTDSPVVLPPYEVKAKPNADSLKPVRGKLLKK